MENKREYNQWWALWAIVHGSFKANLKNPQALFFSLVFPMIFVFIFGAVGDGNFTRFQMAVGADCDTLNPVYQSLEALPYIGLKLYSDTVKQKEDLEKGKIAAIVSVLPIKSPDWGTTYVMKLRSTSASTQDLAQLEPLLELLAAKLEKQVHGSSTAFLKIEKEIYNVRPYKTIDFILPGQVGFSLLFSTLFGIAFTFYNLREQLVLKRFYATPVNRLNILVGIGMSRIFFQLLTVVILITVGHFVLGFTLAHGLSTYFSMVFMSVLFLFFLMSVGLIFSSIVKNDTYIPLLINIFSLPQMLLSGTFFSNSIFPKWIQQVSNILPLTHFNEAMRKISFEGVAFSEYAGNSGVLVLWTLLGFGIVWKVFRWE